MCGLFALDTSFMMFYNMSPRISAEELLIDMPCSSESYFANSIETCQNAARAELESRPPQLSALMALYLGNQLELPKRPEMKCLSILHFFVVILGTYELRYQIYRC